MATLMVGSTMAVGAVSASAATVKKPASVKAANTSKGIKITWKKAKGAKKYQLYRGTKLVVTTKKTSYVDKKAKTNGRKYTYKVKSVNGKVKKTSKAVSVYRVQAPKITKITTGNALKVKWKAGAGTKFKLYRKINGGKFTLLKTLKTKTYTDKTVKSGNKYSYKVKALIGKSVSVASAAKTKTYLAPVDVTDIVVNRDGKKTITDIKWEKTAGATAYNIYKMDITNTKTLVATVKDTAYTATYEGDNPTVYSYYICAVKGKAKSSQEIIKMIHTPSDTYFTDKDGNVNVNLVLNEGESYYEGGQLYLFYLFSYPNDDAMKATVEVVEGTDVVNVENGVIDALKAGNAKIKVSFSKELGESVSNLISNEFLGGKNYGNKLTTGVAYVNVTVK